MNPEAEAETETDEARVDALRSVDDASVESPDRREAPERVERAEVAPEDCVRVRGGILCGGVCIANES